MIAASQSKVVDRKADDLFDVADDVSKSQIILVEEDVED